VIKTGLARGNWSTQARKKMAHKKMARKNQKNPHPVACKWLTIPYNSEGQISRRSNHWLDRGICLGM